MRFKDWFIEQNGLGGTSLGYGGASIGATTANNSTMPYGVRSKYVTKDTNEKDNFDKGTYSKSPDAAFGFQTPKQKKQSIESQPNLIDKGRKAAVPMRDDDLGITY